MLTLIQFNLVPLAVALLVGAAVGRWMFAHRRNPPISPEEPKAP